MVKIIIALLLLGVSTKHLSAQKEIEVSIPETYELANIILALTDYGRTES